eukprot:10634168-Lingulodinium_polyedra.AAC.1
MYAYTYIVPPFPRPCDYGTRPHLARRAILPRVRVVWPRRPRPMPSRGGNVDAFASTICPGVGDSAVKD